MGPSTNPRPFRSFQYLAAVAAMTLLILQIGCGTQTSQDPIESEPQKQETAKIEWYEGDVDEAFRVASSTGKPLFLYWGAQWCPPCHYLKNKIFSRPEFVAQMKNFVPIYLDGDTERAQALGEELDVQGYPTVIIFNSSGDEVMRMSSSVPIEQYAIVLDNAVSGMKPVQEVLTEVLEIGPEASSTADLSMLANYSWSQASNLDLSEKKLLQAFKKLYEETPESQAVNKSRFLAFYVQGLIREQLDDDSNNPSGLDSASRLALIPPVVDVLGTAKLRNSNLVFVSYGPRYKLDLLTPTESSDREDLLAAWMKAAQAIEQDESLTVDDRLGGTMALVDLATTPAQDADSEDSDFVPAEMQQHARDQIAWALETVDDQSELQSVVNALAYILEMAGLEDEAETLLIEKLSDTTAPYYFMAWVADLKEQAGETDQAVEWYRQAYDNSEGRYSRFRYGSTYLRKLMELQPESSEAIETDSLEILAELLGHSDAFAGGNFSRLNSLESAYQDWGEEQRDHDSIGKIRDFVHAACERYPEENKDDQYERCTSFLSLDSSSEMMM